MTNPLDAEARDEIHPDAYEILKAATKDHAEFLEIDGKKYSFVDVKAAYRAVSTALEMRDAERAEVERLRADAHRMDWLVMQYVEVRTPLRYGSRSDFVVSTRDDDGEELPSDLRKKVDERLCDAQAQENRG